MHVSNYSVPILRDAGQHQDTMDLEVDEVSPVQFMVPWLPTPEVETIYGFLCPGLALGKGQAAKYLISNSLVSKIETLFPGIYP